MAGITLVIATPHTHPRTKGRKKEELSDAATLVIYQLSELCKNTEHLLLRVDGKSTSVMFSTK